MGTQESLAADVVSVLRQRNLPFMLVGASALAARGFARGTHDIDFMSTEPAVLDLDWNRLVGADVQVVVFRGDADDPLVGTVRMGREGARPVDVVVGKWRWQLEVIERSREINLDVFRVKVPDVADLVLLKLDAGSPLDLRDAQQLLEIHDPSTREEIEARLAATPLYLQTAWTRFLETC